MKEAVGASFFHLKKDTWQWRGEAGGSTPRASIMSIFVSALLRYITRHEIPVSFLNLELIFQGMVEGLQWEWKYESQTACHFWKPSV